MPKSLKILYFLWKSNKIVEKFGKFHLDIHLTLTYPKPSKNAKNHWKSWICWNIPQNWEKIWEISSWYPFSHHRVQNFQKCQKPSKFLKFVEKSPKIERKFGKFYLGIHLALTYPKPSKNVKTHWKSWILLENPPKLRENLGNFILISL